MDKDKHEKPRDKDRDEKLAKIHQVLTEAGVPPAKVDPIAVQIAGIIWGS
jgi:hypothetical protein